MPLFNLKCSCGASHRTLAGTWEQVKTTCKSCGHTMQRDARGPNSMVMERLDNGLMPTAVERLARSEELSKERARNADPLAGAAIERVTKEDKILED